MGMRSLYYHHQPGHLFAFATDPRALLVLPQIPYRLNEVRIADFLVDLEAADKTSTFFNEVFRLPAAHTATVTADGMRLKRYWALEPGPELHLSSDEAYTEAFLDVLQSAIHSRLRAAGGLGSMLSGGMDSGATVAIARKLVAAESRGPLRTFSVTFPEREDDPETLAIMASLTMDGLDPTLLSVGRVHELQPDLERLTWDMEEPFDGHMTLPRALYLSAAKEGVTTILDGTSGDVVLTGERYIARLLRSGRWPTAYREAVGQKNFYRGASPVMPVLIGNARVAFAPNRLLRRARVIRDDLQIARTIQESLISADFATRVNLRDRLKKVERQRSDRPLARSGVERARAIDDPHLTVGRERYDRVAAAAGVEPRDPFFDRRVASFCTRLPGAQTLDHGWPKAILRKATAGLLPDAVRWRRGKEHLGSSFTEAFMHASHERLQDEIDTSVSALGEYVDMTRALKYVPSVLPGGEVDSRSSDLRSGILRRMVDPQCDATTFWSTLADFRGGA